MVYILQYHIMEQRIIGFYLYISFLVPDDLILFKLPCSHKPEEDRISKSIAIHQSIVDIIIASLLGAKERTCTSTNTAFTDGTERNMLYISQSSASMPLPPFIIEFQHMIIKDFMCRSIQYCINASPVNSGLILEDLTF
ncbi:unnamed protein product [Rhizopus stolonifer]